MLRLGVINKAVITPELQVGSTTNVTDPGDRAADASAIRDGRLEFLDALRGIAAIAVLLEHTFGLIFPGYTIWSGKHFDLGQFGVVSFFLVSGFIIPVSLERSGALRAFWLNRFFRLYPIYWFSLLMAAGLALAGHFELPAPFHAYPIRAFLANATMLQALVRVPDAMANYWTLSVELAFYALCSILFLTTWLSKSLLWAWSAVLGMLTLVTVAGVALHRSIPAGRVGLIVTAFFGTVAFAIHARRLRPRVLLGLAPALALTIVVAFYFRFEKFPAPDDGGARFYFSAALLSWMLAYLLFAVLYALRRYEFPAWSVWLGRISYSLYLTGALVLYMVSHLVSNSLAILALTLVGSIAASWLTYTVIEKPAVAFHKAQVKRQRLERVRASTSNRETI